MLAEIKLRNLLEAHKRDDGNFDDLLEDCIDPLTMCSVYYWPRPLLAGDRHHDGSSYEEESCSYLAPGLYQARLSDSVLHGAMVKSLESIDSMGSSAMDSSD